MDWKDEWKPLGVMMAVFLAFFYLPIGTGRFDNAVMEALHLTKWYAQEHVILCLVPAFFIAGAIAVFVSQASVIKYLGVKANKVLAYSVGAVSGTILAVCSCTVLPLFAGIYQRGAGLGPAIAFLYSGPAINVLAIILTARVLGLELGIARAIGAVAFSVIIGLLMHFIFIKEEIEKANSNLAMPEKEGTRPLWQTSVYFLAMIAILVFANWGRPEEAGGFWYAVYSYKWSITGLASVFFAVLLITWFGIKWWKILLAAASTIVLAIFFPHKPLIPFSAAVIGFSIIISLHKGETEEWFKSSWDFAKRIMPLLFFGVLIAGALLGRPGNEGLIPSEWISGSVGGNSIWSNFFASVAGAFMYFATLTEVPILEGLIGNGMGKGPALALLLAGPALSLPNMLVIRSVIGTKKTAVFITLVVIMATITGMLYGAFFE